MTDTDALDAGLMAARDLLARIIDLAFDPANGDKTFAECREEGARVLLAALRSERVRGEESMRDRAAAVCTDHMEGRYHLSDLATHVGDKQGAAVHYAAGNALGEARAAIKALPTTDQETTHG